MEDHPIIWTAPEPLWAEAATPANGGHRDLLRAPAILRFATDDFMPQFLDVLSTNPRRLGEFRLVRETWRGRLRPQPLEVPAPPFARTLQRLGVSRRRQAGREPATHGQKPVELDDTRGVPLKLYQPAHQRYYLITACLVCQIPGLPDRRVDAAKEQQAGYVMRRLLPPGGSGTASPAFDASTWKEHAWIGTPEGNVWREVSNPEEMFEGEEVLPMFAANYTQDDQRLRRLFAALIPVGRREAYLAGRRVASDAPTAATSSAASPVTARKILLRKQVIEPWKNLIERAAFQHAALAKVASDGKSVLIPETTETREALQNAREQAQVVSWFILLDLAQYLQTYLPDLWQHIAGTGSPSLSTPATAALQALQGIGLGTTLKSQLEALKHPALQVKPDLVQALQTVASPSVGTLLDTATAPFHHNLAPTQWPTFLFPLADLELPDQAARPPTAGVTPQAGTEETEEIPSGTAPTDLVDKLAALLVRALPLESSAPQPATPLAATASADGLVGWFTLRCVFRRPGCGPLERDVVSSRTESFQLAGFFDPDAPARPIRIGLPVDTTPGGLRKFDKNTAFVMSNTLCGQVKRLKGMSLADLVLSVLPWPFHKDLSVPEGGPCQDGGGDALGLACSISIPIITICALILLIIMVTLLDLIFRWLPFFMICFPVKGLDAKRS